MKHRIWFKALALVAVLTIVATACADDSGGGDGGTGAGEVDCATVEFGCVEVGADEPINLGAAQVISGADASLGQDQVNALELALDYLDGTFDQTNGTLLDHPVELTVEDELCSADGGQTAGTALAADTSIVAVVGTSCSSAALGVADTILGDKGITLISGSNTSPALTDPSCTTRSTLAPRTTTGSRVRSAPSSRWATTSARPPQPRSRTRAPTRRGSSVPSRRTSRPEVAPSPDRSRSTPRTPTSSRSSGRWERGSRSPVLPDLRGSVHADHQAGAGHHARRRADRGGRLPVERHPEERGTCRRWRLGIVAGPLGLPDERVLLGGVHPAYQEAFGTEPLAVFHAHSFDAANVVFGDRGGRDRQRRRVALDPSPGTVTRSSPRTATRASRAPSVPRYGRLRDGRHDRTVPRSRLAGRGRHGRSCRVHRHEVAGRSPLAIHEPRRRGRGPSREARPWPLP